MREKENHNYLHGAAVYTVRIAAVTTAAPVLAGAAASAATAKLVGCELRQLASSPLSAEAGRLKAEFRELAAANGAGAHTPARHRAARGAAPIARLCTPVRLVPELATLDSSR